MSTAARKARKRRGERFTKGLKVPTPFEERSAVAGLVPGPGGTPRESRLQPRSDRKVRRLYEARGLNYVGESEKRKGIGR